MKELRTGAAALFACALAATAFVTTFAEAKNGSGDDAKPCRADAQRLCAPSLGDPKAVRACLVAHRSELSKPCIALGRSRRAAQQASLSPEARARLECRREYQLGRKLKWREEAILSQCMNQKARGSRPPAQ